MTPDEIKSAITGWCSQGTDVQLVEDRSDPGADFVLGLRAAVHASVGTVPVEVRLDQGGDRVTVTSTSTAVVGVDGVRSLLDRRPASVHGDVEVGSTVLTGHVYTDGFSRHTFMRTVEEVAKTRTLIDGLAGAGVGSVAGDDLGAQPASSLPSPSSTLPAPSFAGAAAGGLASTPLSGQLAPQAQPAAAAFAPTHTVPPQGMQAWAAPDPNGAIVATLGGGLPIQITEVRGAWARVLCSNGWTGWVDGRIIGVAR
jgi:Bacterial SH3 domain